MLAVPFPWPIWHLADPTPHTAPPPQHLPMQQRSLQPVCITYATGTGAVNPLDFLDLFIWPISLLLILGSILAIFILWPLLHRPIRESQNVEAGKEINTPLKSAEEA